jgi:hypothetical protein
MVSYDTDVYGAHGGYTRSVVVRIRLRAVLAICAQRERERENISLSRNMQLQCPVENLFIPIYVKSPNLIQYFFLYIAGVI